jgi:hypothetical protein
VPHTITYNAEEHIIEMKAQGSLTMDEASEIISDMIKFVKERDCHFILSDYREAKLDLSILEIYGLPKMISTLLADSELSAHKIKRALVVEQNSKNFKFFETVTLNNMQWAKLFVAIDKAKQWLLEK